MTTARRLRQAAACGATALAALVALAPRAARADGAQLDRFEPSERGSEFFAADSLDFEGNLRPAAGVVTTYAHGLRIFGTPVEGTKRTLVEDQLVFHPGASLVVAPGARFAVDVPLVLQRGVAHSLSGQLLDAPRSPVPGDVRFSFDLRLFGPERESRDGVVVAGGVSVYLPTGSRDDYVSDGYARVGVRLASALRAGPLLAALRVGYMYRRDLEDFGSVEMGSDLDGSFAVGVRAGAWVIGPEIAGSTILRDDPFGLHPTPVDGLLGAHVAVGHFTAGFGGGTSLDRGIGAPDLRLMASLEWTPPGPSGVFRDRDRDGVPDDDDVCPDVPGAPGGPASSRGCPEAPRDADGDGVIDGEDACPDLAGVRTRDPMTSGCPDADHDGVPDPVDACPRVPGERSPVPRFDGCPPDGDGDEVPDATDACPSVPGVPTGDPKTNGCPPAAPTPSDRDKDGVLDPADACPDEPGISSTDSASNGCPLVRRDAARILLAEPIAFEPGTTKLVPASGEVLEALAAWLRDHPDVARVRVEAHTSGGAKSDRKKLLRRTAAQARVVVKRLMKLGVARARLQAVGVGADNPIAPNTTPDGRAQNRRIELRVVSP